MKFLAALLSASYLLAAASAQGTTTTTTRTTTTVTSTSTRPTTSTTATTRPTTTVTSTTTATPTSTVTATPTTTVTTSTATPTTTTSVTTTSGTATTSTSSTSTTTTSTGPPVPTYSTTVSYDTVYDNRSGSLRSVACSDGVNGLLSKNFTTFGSLPRFPLIGGAFAVGGWNSPSCGTCWELAYTTRGAGNATTTTRINILAIDVAVDSFNVALGAMNQLTGGRGVELGRVNVVAKQVAASLCGL